MSSSSATAANSRSPSPATPASSDSLDTVAVEPNDLSSWCSSLPNDKSSSTAAAALWDELSHGYPSSQEEINILSLDDLIQSHVYDDSPFDGLHPTISEHPLANDGTHSHSQEECSEQTPTPQEDCPVPTTTLPAPEDVPQTKPIPPPASQPRKRNVSASSQTVVYPAKDSCSNLPIIIPGIPPSGTKSRVETQVRVTVDLAHASSSAGQYDRVGSWKWLQLPKGTATKKRTRKEGKIQPTPEETLHLTVEVTCASAPHMRVVCCSNCQNREAKRVARKLAARVRPPRSDSDSPDADDVSEGKTGGSFNIIQFNCPQVLDFSTGTVVLPLRITCYCRHHKEKVGFNVHFSMLDHQGRIVGTGISPPIMITDDHKSTGALSKTSTNGDGDRELFSFSPRGEIMEGTGPVKRKLADASEQSKKRVKSGSGSRITRNPTIAASNSPSPFSSALPTRTVTPQFINSTPPSLMDNSSPSSPPAFNNFIFQSVESFGSPATPNDHDSGIGSEDMQPGQGQFELDPNIQRAMSPSFMSPDSSSAENSILPSSLAAPVAIQPMPFMFFHADPPPPIASLPKPKIHRLIPSSGPTYGGIEVTILGSNFHPSVQLDCLFGDVVASSTQRWSDNTLVCILPPRISSGVVAVWFNGIGKDEDGTPPCLFTYMDESDRALMELALQVVGLKMTGKLEDAKSVAMRIVGPGPAGDNGSDPNNTMGFAPNALSLDLQAMLRGSNFGDELEKLVIKLLSLLDVDVESASPVSLSSAISFQCQSGQTLLHLATFLHYPSLVRFLVEHGVDLDVRDRNGYTALHVAGFVGARNCARVLIKAGADVEIVDALGKTAQEVASFDLDDLDRSVTDEPALESHIDEEESRWGDGEEETEDEAPIRPRSTHPRRATRSIRREVEVLSSDHSDEDTAAKVLDNAVDPTTPLNEKKIPPPIVDEKQAASFMETIQRTLARVQGTQGIMPHLPLPHLPNLPGMPGVNWAALNQIPMVFPVYAPWPTFLGDGKREGTMEGPAPEDLQNPGEQSPKGSIRALASPQEWKSFWEKWMMQGLLMQQRAVGAEAPTYDPPPMYTPRPTGETDVPIAPSAQPEVASTKDMEDEPEEEEPKAGPSNAGAGSERAAVRRRLGYESAVKLTDQEVNAYEYHPAKPQVRQLQKKEDRMLIMFWIPILFLALLWAFFHAVRIAVHSARTVTPLKALLRV